MLAIRIFAKTGIAFLINLYFGFGEPLNKFVKVQAPILKRDAFELYSIEQMMISNPFLFKILSLKGIESAAIFPSPHIACSEINYFSYLMTANKI